MRQAEIDLKGVTALWPDCYAWENSFKAHKSFECDYYILTQGGEAIEVEYKNNFGDYRLDFTKCIGSRARDDNGQIASGASRRTRRPGDIRTFKHDLIKAGKLTNRFYFMFPEHMPLPYCLPDYAGAIRVSVDLFGYTSASVVKPARQLHERLKGVLMF